MTFTEDDTYVLLAATVEADSDGITEWMKAHIHNTRDMHTLLEFLCRLISTTWPLGVTRDAHLGPQDFWAMRALPTANPDSEDAARMVVAALNADWDMLTAIIVATLQKPQEHHAHTLVEVLAALRDGLEAMKRSGAA